MNEYTIKKVEFDIIEEAFSMVLNVFMEFNGADYSREGVETFKRDIIESEEFKNRFKTGEQVMLGAFIDNKIVGVIAISIRNHISLLFVDKDYHKIGIATALFDEILNVSINNNIDKISLNSSPYAVAFYTKIGFIATNVYQVKNGIKYMPMEFSIYK